MCYNNGMDIKAISFNVRNTDDDNGNLIKERAERLFAVTNNYDADVIGFQEYSELWEEYVPKRFFNDYEFFNRYRSETGFLESTPILWKKEKFECLDRGCFWLSDTPEVESGGWDTYGCNRTCLYATLKNKQNGTIFTFFNTHFGFGDENQVKSVKLICKYMKSVSNYPTFISGDFNMTPTSLGYLEMVKNLKDVNELTVKDRRSTYHGYVLDNNFNEHIDYVFIDENFSPITFKIIDETVDGKFPSDHYGIYTELKIK